MAEGLAEHPVAAEMVQLQIIHLAGQQRAARPHNVGPPAWLRPDALAVEALRKEKEWRESVGGLRWCLGSFCRGAGRLTHQVVPGAEAE